MKQHIKILKAHNSWRRGDGSPQGNPTEIGLAIDACVKSAERYELMRTLTPREFKQMYQENLKMGTSFDNLVDVLIASRKR